MFIDRGRIVLECSMEEFDSRYLGSDGESGANLRSTRSQSDARATGLRTQRSAVSIVSIATNSRHSERCAGRASPTCSLP